MLGNCKPQPLLDVELALWRALISVATGETSAYLAVKNFLDNEVGWEDLQKVPQVDCEFFKGGTVILGLFLSLP
jgi:hypothetical protein